MILSCSFYMFSYCFCNYCMCFNLLTLNSLCHTSIAPRLLRTSLWLFGCLQHEKTVKKLSKLMAIHWGDPSWELLVTYHASEESSWTSFDKGMLRCFYSAGNPAWRQFQAGVPVVPQPMFPDAAMDPASMMLLSCCRVMASSPWMSSWVRCSPQVPEEKQHAGRSCGQFCKLRD